MFNFNGGGECFLIIFIHFSMYVSEIIPKDPTFGFFSVFIWEKNGNKKHYPSNVLYTWQIWTPISHDRNEDEPFHFVLTVYFGQVQVKRTNLTFWTKAENNSHLEPTLPPPTNEIYLGWINMFTFAVIELSVHY